MMAREIAQGGKRVVDFDRGEAGDTASARDYRGCRAAPRCLGQIRMTVAVGAAKRDEQSAGAERARVARHSTHDRIRRAEHFAAGCGGDLVQPEGALVDRYRRRHRYGRAGRGPGTLTRTGYRSGRDLSVITCLDAA